MNALNKILTEITDLASKLKIDDQLITAINNAKTVFVFGAGRSGLILSAFAMRLAQMNKKAIVIGQVTAKPIHSEDLLLVASGSGETFMTKHYAQIAKEQGARVILLSTKSKNSLAEIADHTISLGGKEKYHQVPAASQPLGSAYEQILFLYLEAVVLELMTAWQLTEAQMAANHTNLE